MSHVVLLGDSIFDNGAYVPGEPDVVRQLQARLGGAWTATLLAIDGSVTADVPARQLPRLPPDASHLVVSAGGNDALGAASLLAEPAGAVGEALARLAEVQARFAQSYLRMLEAVLARGLPTAVCTIYDANYPEPQRQVVVAGLALFNDVISRLAFARGLPLIDLRLVCAGLEDYANPIEPSARGGAKIASAIVGWLAGGRAGPRSQIWL